MSAAPAQNTGANSLPKSIGRFQPLDILGQGAQGVVYLAEDTNLGRKVAIKTLDNQQRSTAQLTQEARHVSQLTHPHIIPLYEIGFDHETPYLVYQYYEGEQLQDKLAATGPLSQYEAIKIINQVLDGIGYAHRQQIIHRDLNPSNLMIDKEGLAHIMDFGIAIIVGEANVDNTVTGTASYMAPEQLNNGALTPAVDIYACGLLLYEMLTGHKAYSATNVATVAYKVNNNELVPPSKRNSTLDKELDTICLKALALDPADRFSNTIEMQEAIKKFLTADITESTSSENNTASAVDFLLRRMKRKQDFPAISSNISELNQKTSGSTKSSANELSNIILKDYALTTKLLRLVNSSFYGQFGGEITTVSRAIVILGYEQVRAAVLSIILFEHLQNSEQANDLKNAAYKALMSGIIAREHSKTLNNLQDDHVETCFISAMFHLLGQLLTIYYFPEDYAAMKSLVQSKGIDENQAMRSVLGVTYEELGLGIAKEWKLPAVISDSMRALPEGTVSIPKNSNEAMRQLSCFANELCTITSDEIEIDDACTRLVGRYKEALNINEDKIARLLESSIKEADEFTRILNIDTSKVTVFENIRSKTAQQSEQDKWQTEVKEKDENDTDLIIETDSAAQRSGEEKLQDILVNGISEITNTMLNDYNINDVLTMVLETIYRGMGFNRVLFALLDPRTKQVAARFGFGKNIDDIMPRFRYTIDGGDDVFVATVRQGKEFIILDVNSEQYKDRVPTWVRKLTSPTTIILYPLVVNKRCLGVIYADNDDSSISISMEALGFFKTLRNQACLAIQQKQK